MVLPRSAMLPVPLPLPSLPIPLQLCMRYRMISRWEPPIAWRERHQDMGYPARRKVYPGPAVGRSSVPPPSIRTIPVAVIEQDIHANAGNKVYVGSGDGSHLRGSRDRVGRRCAVLGVWTTFPVARRRASGCRGWRVLNVRATRTSGGPRGIGRYPRLMRGYPSAVHPLTGHFHPFTGRCFLGTWSGRVRGTLLLLRQLLLRLARVNSVLCTRARQRSSRSSQ
jgi:hypothetical protein